MSEGALSCALDDEGCIDRSGASSLPLSRFLLKNLSRDCSVELLDTPCSDALLDTPCSEALIDASRFVTAADALEGPRGDRERSAGASPEDEDTPRATALSDACPVVASADAFASPREDRDF